MLMSILYGIKEEDKMRKVIAILILLMVLLSLVGCKKTTVETASNSQTTNTENASEKNSNPESTQNPSSTNTSSGEPVTNEGLMSDLQGFVENFYYNYLFAPQLESGAFTETDMQLFAISYIYQYANEGLRFDSEKFLLYIPEENVSEVIKRFFDYDFTKHKYPENSSITYENGYYLMKATTDKLGEKPVIKEAIDYGNSKYKVVFESSDPNVNEYIVAMIEEKEGRFVLLTYKKFEKTQEQN